MQWRPIPRLARNKAKRHPETTPCHSIVQMPPPKLASRAGMHHTKRDPTKIETQMPPSKTVQDYIRTIENFPHEGIMFRDVTTLFADPRGFRMAIDQMLHPYAGRRIDKVVGLEARGFILGGAIAHQLSVGFVPIRKRASCRARRSARITRWNTARRRSRSTMTPSRPAKRSSSSMTCSPPVAPPPRASN